MASQSTSKGIFPKPPLPPINLFGNKTLPRNQNPGGCVSKAGTRVSSQSQFASSREGSSNSKVSGVSYLELIPQTEQAKESSFPIRPSPPQDYSPRSPNLPLPPPPDFSRGAAFSRAQNLPLPPPPDFSRGVPPPVAPRPQKLQTPDYSPGPPSYLAPDIPLPPAPDFSRSAAFSRAQNLPLPPPPDFSRVPPPVPPRQQKLPTPDYSPGSPIYLEPVIPPKLPPRFESQLPSPDYSPIPPALPSRMPLPSNPGLSRGLGKKRPLPPLPSYPSPLISTCDTTHIYDLPDDECSPKKPKYTLPSNVAFEEALNMKGGTDRYVKSKRVFELTQCTFKDFLEKQDVALVLFYDINMKRRRQVDNIAAKNFIQAAENTVTPNSAYATVNCFKNVRLCVNEGIVTFPFYKLYSKGVPIGSIQDTTSFDHKKLKAFVEQAPITK